MEKLNSYNENLPKAYPVIYWLRRCTTIRFKKSNIIKPTVNVNIPLQQSLHQIYVQEICMDSMRSAQVICMDSMQSAQVLYMDNVQSAQVIYMDNIQSAQVICMDNMQSAHRKI